jgi:hypothetical protein
MSRDKYENAKVTRSSRVQPLNTNLPNELDRVKPEPTLMFTRLVQPWNALSPMEFTLLGMTNPIAVLLLAMDVQSWKHPLPRDNHASVAI